MYTKSLFCLVEELCALHYIVFSVCIRPCLSVSSMALSLSVNVIRYHYTKLIAGCIDSLEHLNQRKSLISKECCEAKVSLCFARRIENNKSKKIKTKANAFSERECSDRVDWSSSWTRSHFGTNAFRTSLECVHVVRMSVSCTVYVYVNFLDGIALGMSCCELFFTGAGKFFCCALTAFLFDICKDGRKI